MPAKRATPTALGTIRKRPSGRFSACYRFDGRTFTAPHTFASKADAQGWLATERADRLRGTWRDPRQGALTVREYLTAWLDSRRNLAPSTATLYRKCLNRWILPRLDHNGRTIELGALTIGQLSPAVIRRWFALVSELAAHAATVRAATTPARVLHPARVWALAEGLTAKRTGKLSPAVLAAWKQAGSPVPPPRPVPHDPGRTAAAQAYRQLHVALADAVRDGLLNANPCSIPGAGITRPKESGTATPAEVTQLAAAMPAHLGAAVIVAAWSGLRFGELFALARRHVDLDAGTIRVERALSRTRNGTTFTPTKTAGSVRTVHLPRFVVDALATHMATYTGPRADALIFTGRQGQPVHASNVTDSFRRARETIGRPELKWHSLRHTGATLAYTAGASVREVQRRLGHTTTRAAMIYAHAADGSDAIIAERLNAAFGTPGMIIPFTAGRRTA